MDTETPCEYCTQSAKWLVLIQLVDYVYRVKCCNYHANRLHSGVNDVVDSFPIAS